MSVSGDFSKSIQDYLGIELDKTNRYIKVDLASSTLSAKSVQECKHPLKQWDLFVSVIQKLRSPLKGQQPVVGDKAEQKALCIFNHAIKKIEQFKGRSFDLRATLATALNTHADMYLKSTQTPVRKPSMLVSSVRRNFEPQELKRELTHNRANSLEGLLDAEQMVQKSTSLQKSGTDHHFKRNRKHHRSSSHEGFSESKSGAAPKDEKAINSTPIDREEKMYHVRKRSNTNDMHLSKNVQSSTAPSILQPLVLSPRSSLFVSRMANDLKSDILKAEKEFELLMNSLNQEWLNALQNYWKKANTSSFKKLVEENKSDKEFIKGIHKLTNIPLMRYALQTQIERYLREPLNEDFLPLSQDIIRQILHIKHVDDRRGFLIDFSKQSLEERFHHRTEAFSRLLTSLLNALPFENMNTYGEVFHQAWKTLTSAVKTPDEESAAKCCDQFFKILRNTELSKFQKNLKPNELFYLTSIGMLLAHTFRTFRQSWYVLPSSEIRHFFTSLDYRVEAESCTHVFSIRESGEIEVDITHKTTYTQEDALTLSITVKNRLVSSCHHYTEWKSHLEFALSDVVPLNHKLVVFPDDMQRFLKKYVVVPLCKLGFPIEL